MSSRRVPSERSSRIARVARDRLASAGAARRFDRDRRIPGRYPPRPAMRVLFLTDSLSDLDGVGRYTVRLIQALERAAPGFEARVMLARKHRPTSAEVPERWDVEVALPPDYFFH